LESAAGHAANEKAAATISLDTGTVAATCRAPRRAVPRQDRCRCCDRPQRGSRGGFPGKASHVDRRDGPLPLFFTGHDPDGEPARSGQHEHLYFLADDADGGDGRIDQLAVIAPRRRCWGPTAKALGIEVPDMLVALADEAIE
jgi:hypothetical protein